MFEFPVPELWNLPERRGWTEPWRAAAPAGECAVIEANPEKKDRGELGPSSMKTF